MIIRRIGWEPLFVRRWYYVLFIIQRRSRIIVTNSIPLSMCICLNQVWCVYGYPAWRLMFGLADSHMHNKTGGSPAKRYRWNEWLPTGMKTSASLRVSSGPNSCYRWLDQSEQSPILIHLIWNLEREVLSMHLWCYYIHVHIHPVHKGTLVCLFVCLCLSECCSACHWPSFLSCSPMM